MPFCSDLPSTDLTVKQDLQMKTYNPNKDTREEKVTPMMSASY